MPVEFTTAMHQRGHTLAHQPLDDGSDTALAELLAGRPGSAVFNLLRRVIRAVARRHGYPHPDSDGSWDDDDALDAAISSFFADKDGQRRLDTLALDATNDQHLRAMLLTTVHNWFRDLARATPRGRLHRSTQRRLEEEPDVFEEVAPRDFWTLRAVPREPGVVDDATLDRALGQVNITVIRARPDGVNERPWASREDQVAALRAMLTEAACAVHLKAIVRAIAARIGLLQRPTHIEIDEAGAELAGTVEHFDDEGALERAAEIYAELSIRERHVLARAEQTLREIEDATGIPRSSVSDTKRRIEEVLRRTSATDDHAVLAPLRAMCDQFDRTRTAGSGLSSPLNERDQSER